MGTALEWIEYNGVFEGCLTYKRNKNFVYDVMIDDTELVELVDWQLDIVDIEMNDQYDLISFGKVRITVERLDSD